MKIIRNRNLRADVLAGKCRECGTMVECSKAEATWLEDRPGDPTACYGLECPDGCGWIYLSGGKRRMRKPHNAKLRDAGEGGVENT